MLLTYSYVQFLLLFIDQSLDQVANSCFIYSISFVYADESREVEEWKLDFATATGCKTFLFVSRLKDLTTTRQLPDGEIIHPKGTHSFRKIDNTRVFNRKRTTFYRT